MDVEESHRCGVLWSSGERNAEEHVSQHIHRGNGKNATWEGVQMTRRRAHKEILEASHVRQNS